MKKLLVFSLLALFLTPAFAEIKKGDLHLTLLGGWAYPISEYDVINNGATATGIELGSSGFLYGAQAMYFASPYFGIGLEFNGVSFGDEKKDVQFRIGDTVVTTETIDSKNKRYNVLLAARYNFMPESHFRFYLPFAAGLSDVVFDTEYASSTTSDDSWGPAFYFGLGAELELLEIFIVGAEARYSGYFLDKDSLHTDTGYFSELSLLVKAGFRF